MLVLSRKIGEIIHINDNIAIKVIDIRGRNVRIGIEAPQEINILRGELHGEPPTDFPDSQAAALVAEESPTHTAEHRHDLRQYQQSRLATSPRQ